MTTYQPVSPPIVDGIVARCLAKDPDDRWQTARDLKSQLEWVSARLTDGSALGSSAAATPPPPPPARTKTAAYVIAALVAGVVLATAVTWMLWHTPPAAPVVSRFAIELPEGQAFTRAGRHVLALSPDGTRTVYIANQQLYMRVLNDLTATVIPGTEATDPAEAFFSPDGQWVAFWSNQELKKVPIAGGTPVTLAAVENPWGASWYGDRILLGQATPRGVVEVPANGGEARLLIKVDEKNEWVQNPQFVAGERAVVFALRTGTGSWDDAAIVVQELASGHRTVLIKGGTDPHVLPSGHLTFVREATLFAIAFDEQRLEVSGSQVPMQRAVRQAPLAASGAAQWAWSPSGSVVFVPGEANGNERVLVWVDRKGGEQKASEMVRPINILQSSLRLSPDGTKAALTIDTVAATGSAATGAPIATSQGSTSAGSDVWMWDSVRGTLTRVSVTGTGSSPLWTPDGKKLCFKSGTTDVMCQSADGSGQVERVATIEGLASIRSFTPDGTRLLSSVVTKTGNDIFMTTLGSSPATRPLIQTSFSEGSAALSPDGRWLAYQSNETGRLEVYVRPFPAVDQGRSQISIEGGVEPRWAHNGRELYFMSGGGPSPRVLWAVPIVEGPSFSAGKPVTIVKPSNSTAPSYDVAPDGRFLFHISQQAAPSVARPQVVFVQNWIEELKARMRPGSTPQ